MREVAGKIAEVVKRPFGGKGGRKGRPTEEEIRKKVAEERIARLEKAAENPDSSPPSSTAFNGFFYTDEKFVAQFEDGEILERVRAAHPEFDPKAGDDAKTRKAILQVLDDSDLVSDVMDMYNMTVFDFFKFLFRMEPGVFKGAFIPKV